MIRALRTPSYRYYYVPRPTGRERRRVRD